MELQIYLKKKKKRFFQQYWNLFSDFFITTESTAAGLLLFMEQYLASTSKCIQLFAITWAGLGSNNIDSTLTERWVCAQAKYMWSMGCWLNMPALW